MAYLYSKSFSEIKAECKARKISPYGTKAVLVKKLTEAHVERMRDRLAGTTTGSSTSPFYPSKSLSTLRSELKARKLPCSGTKDTLVKRLRDADWNTWDSRYKTFPKFGQLPFEIQELIWQYSLPGPRVIVIARKYKPYRIISHKDHHTPNPAALSICRTSRRVALKIYELIFGTNYIYADLDGGDMLYFGPSCTAYNLNSLFEREEEQAPPYVAAELERVIHIVLQYFTYNYYTRFMSETGNGENNRLYTDLARFKGLKKLSLSCGGSDIGSYLHHCGQAVIQDDARKFAIMDADDYWSYAQKEAALAIKSGFDKYVFEETTRSIPEVQLVEVNRIIDAPQREIQEANGEEYSELYVRFLIHFDKRLLTLAAV